MKLKKRKKRRNEKVRNNRIIAALSILVAATVISLGAYAFVQRERLNRVDANTKAQRRIDSANAAADAQRRIDLANAAADAQRKIDLANAAADAQRKIDLINAQRKIDVINAQAVTNSVFNRLPAILKLVNEPFYISDFLDSSKKNMYVGNLVKLDLKFNKPKRV